MSRTCLPVTCEGDNHGCDPDSTVSRAAVALDAQPLRAGTNLVHLALRAVQRHKQTVFPPYLFHGTVEAIADCVSVHHFLTAARDAASRSSSSFLLVSKTEYEMAIAGTALSMLGMMPR